MKTLVAVFMAMIGLTFSATAFADCYSCNSPCTSCRASNSCNSCQNPCSECACSDPNCGRNPCLSKRDCCKAFGNVGHFVED